MRFASLRFQDRIVIQPESCSAIDGERLSPYMAISKLGDFETPPTDLSFSYSLSLQRMLQGKRLLLDELPFSIHVIYEHYLHGYVSFEKAIIKNGGNLSCRRCGNREKRLFASFSCARCFEEECHYCRKCLTMGRVSECTPLVRWIGPEKACIRHSQSLAWDGELSEAQLHASKAVRDTIGTSAELLIWAVCGAGKTEILFAGIEKALASGMRVCLATPRVDVVLELFPRFKKAFPNIAISALYGGSADRMDEAQLFLSTTHQLLRFIRFFDVMIIDEVDAFPYSYDDMLSHAVEGAKKRDASTIYLTATPNDGFKQRVKQKELECVKIPVRFHRHPLPLPAFKWCGNWRKRLAKKTFPDLVMKWVEQKMKMNRQAFLFVPSIRVMHDVKALLAEHFPGVDSVFADDPERKEKVEAFRRGSIHFLVTTSILERGVTVPNIDVAILGAEDPVFTESALVQMAGRVGRSADFPGGEILFFHFGKTKAMLQAVEHIREMNQEAETIGRK